MFLWENFVVYMGLCIDHELSSDSNNIIKGSFLVSNGLQQRYTIYTHRQRQAFPGGFQERSGVRTAPEPGASEHFLVGEVKAVVTSTTLS